LTCPYFMPIEKLENGNWPHPGRLPLGGGWTGQCTAEGHEGEIPEQQVLETFCNLGYAHGCAWAPRERPWDAVRFARCAPGETGDEGERNTSGDTRVIQLRYVCEHDHLPVEHGVLEYDLRLAMWPRPHSDARVQKMAECFLESCLKKRS
jgi:hypothetical protein